MLAGKDRENLGAELWIELQKRSSQTITWSEPLIIPDLSLLPVSSFLSDVFSLSVCSDYTASLIIFLFLFGEKGDITNSIEANCQNPSLTPLPIVNQSQASGAQETDGSAVLPFVIFSNLGKWFSFLKKTIH